MRLVLEYQDTDDCTYSCAVTYPIEYESAEALSVDFERAMRAGLGSQSSATVMFAGLEMYPPNFFYVDTHTQARVYCDPNIWTIDEWFNHHHK